MTGWKRRAVILPVVLFILLMLGLLIGTFAFKVNADVASVRAAQYQLRTRLAAEAGVEKVKLMLRYDRLNREFWWDNPDELNRIIVYTDAGDSSVYGTNEEFRFPTRTYRFSIVADDAADDEDFCRFGVIDEQSKVNLNTATKHQLLTLVTAAVGDDATEIDPNEIVNAILDWRDTDSIPRGESGDTEGEYYKSLPKPYNVKNGPFDTVEELLLVKGMTPEILYGEDVDRNGLLTPNEDDGDASFPRDNADGRLNRGLYPYLTVLSYDNNVSNDNRQRIHLKGDPNKVRELLSNEFPEEPQVVDYILNAVRTPTGNQGNRQGGRGGNRSGQPPTGQPPTGQPGAPGGQPSTDGATPPAGGRRGASPPGRQPSKEEIVKQSREGENEERHGQPVRPPRRGQMNPPGSGGTQNPPTDAGNNTGSDDTSDGGGKGTATGDASKPPSGENQPQTPGSNNAPGASVPMRTPADLFRPPIVNGVEQPIPLRPEHLAVLLDRTSMDPPDKRLVGLINVNTAPAEVLRTLEFLSEEQVKAIVSTRDGLSAEEMATPAWLVTQNVVDMATFQSIAPHITARGTQFMIESLGFADHVGTVTRLQVVVDMLGPIPQTVYYRDVSGLGASFPIREQDKDRRRGK